jgi:hypothetical protein
MAKREGDEDRPKRSWREVDKMRDKAFSRQRAQEDRAQERMQRSPVYEQYKAKVSKIFEGGEIPDLLREKLDPSGALKARDILLKKIRAAATEDRKAWADSVSEFVEKHELPDDAYLLVDWLDHPKDKVVEMALARLESMAEAGALAGPKCPKSMDQRLRSLELTGGDPEVQARARSLRERLRG